MRDKEQYLREQLPTHHNDTAIDVIFSPTKLKAIFAAMEQYAKDYHAEAVKIFIDAKTESK